MKTVPMKHRQLLALATDDVVPVCVLMGKDSVIVEVPKMSVESFEFFKDQLDKLRAAIVLEEEAITGPDEQPYLGDREPPAQESP